MATGCMTTGCMATDTTEPCHLSCLMASIQTSPVPAVTTNRCHTNIAITSSHYPSVSGLDVYAQLPPPAAASSLLLAILPAPRHMGHMDKMGRDEWLRSTTALDCIRASVQGLEEGLGESVGFGGGHRAGVAHRSFRRARIK